MRAETRKRAKARGCRKALKDKGLETLTELPDEDHLRQMVEAGLSVARERQRLLEQIRETLTRDDVDVERLIPLVRRYCGLTRSLKIMS